MLTSSRQVAWLHGLMDFVFPYLVQFLRQYSQSVDTLMADRKEMLAARKKVSKFRFKNIKRCTFVYHCVPAVQWFQHSCIVLSSASQSPASPGLHVVVKRTCSSFGTHPTYGQIAEAVLTRFLIRRTTQMQPTHRRTMRTWAWRHSC